MKTRFFAFAALALTLAACNNDNENLNDGPVAAKFIADITPATRVNSEGTDWTDGDRIGVTGAGFTNVPYKRENGKFVTDGTVIYFDDTETHTFHAYYPYQAEGGTVTVSTAADKQGTGIDFLFASGATGDTHNPEVSFTDKTDKGGPDNSFHHRMSLIKFTFKPGDGLIFNGMDYTTTLPNPSKPETNQFSAGYAYTYNITLNNKGITVEEPEITPWEPGNSNDVSITL